MDIIRTSWNNRLPPDEFQQLLSQQEDPLLIIHQLFNTIGFFSGKERFDFEEEFFQNHDETQMRILYEYLFVSLSKSPIFFANSIIDSRNVDTNVSEINFVLNKNLNLLGFVRFFCQFGDQLFESYSKADLEIDIKKYSYCCLFTLQICLSFGYDKYSLDYSNFSNNDYNFMNSYEFYVSEIAISKLSSSLSFILLLVRSRLFYRNEIINTRKMFKKRIMLTIKKFSIMAGAEDENIDFCLPDRICFDESDKCEMLLTLYGLNTWRILKFVIFSDRPYVNSKVSLIPRSEILLYIVSDIITIRKNPYIFEFASIEDLYGCYAHTIAQFISFPSLYMIYMITTFLPQYISYAENKLLKTATDVNIFNTYNEEKLHEIFSHMKCFLKSGSPSDQKANDQSISLNPLSPSTDQPNQNLVTSDENVGSAQLAFFEGQLNSKCNILGYYVNYDKLESYFSKRPKGDLNPYDLQSIFESVFQYPSFSSMAINFSLDRMIVDDISFCAKICRQILKNYETLQDFRIYIFKHGKFFELFTQLLRISSITVDENLFNSIWLLALTLFRFTWGSVSIGFKERLLIFVDAIEPPPIRYVVRFLLQIEPEKDDIFLSKEMNYIIDGKTQDQNDSLGFSVFYPYYIAARTLDGLLKGSLQLSEVINFVPDHLYLWPSILLYVYKFPTNENKVILTSIKQSKEELNKLLFKQVMLRMMDESSSKKWMVASEMLDSMIMRENLPKSPNDIKFIIVKHIQMLIVPNILRYSLILSITNIWIALAEHFTFDVFGNIFIHEIVRIMTSFDYFNGFGGLDIKSSFSDNDSPLSLFISSIGHVFAVFLNSDPNRMKKSIDIMIDVVINEDDLLVDSEIVFSFAQLAIIIINDSLFDWKPVFQDLIKTCNSILLNSATDVTNNKCVFAFSVIRIALIIPKLKEVLLNDNSTFQTLIDVNDCSTIIDYLIAKDLYINS